MPYRATACAYGSVLVSPFAKNTVVGTAADKSAPSGTTSQLAASVK